MATNKCGCIFKAFKREVAIEYLQGGLTMQELALMYNLPYIQVISNWVRTCLSPEEVQNKRLSLPQETQKKHLCLKTGYLEGFGDISAVTTYPRS